MERCSHCFNYVGAEAAPTQVALTGTAASASEGAWCALYVPAPLLREVCKALYCGMPALVEVVCREKQLCSRGFAAIQKAGILCIAAKETPANQAVCHNYVCFLAEVLCIALYESGVCFWKLRLAFCIVGDAAVLRHPHLELQ